MTEAHLGGHLNMTHVDEGALKYIKERFDCKSMIDIGCSVSGQVKKAFDLGFEEAVGIDGDKQMLNHNENLILHDFTKNPLRLERMYDLAWSCEFLEHVEEKHVGNFMLTFSYCSYAFVTHALPNTKGHHHVNCQQPEYWIKNFENYGFVFDEAETKFIRQASTMKREFARNNGLFFKKKYNV